MYKLFLLDDYDVIVRGKIGMSQLLTFWLIHGLIPEFVFFDRRCIYLNTEYLFGSPCLSPGDMPRTSDAHDIMTGTIQGSTDATLYISTEHYYLSG